MRRDLTYRFTTEGFTLIELLVVVAIIGLLATIVMVSVNAARERSRLVAGKNFAAQVYHVAGDEISGMWNFDEGAGTTTTDSSQNGNTGTFNGGVTWSADTPSGTGFSASLDGSTGYITGTGSGMPNIVSSGMVTITAWVKLNSVAGIQDIFSKGASGVCYNYGMLTSGGNLIARQSTGDSTAFGSPLSPNRWYNLALVFNASGASGYIDGVLVGQKVFLTIACANSNWTIGKRSAAAPSEFLNGYVDEVRVYAKDLTAREIHKIYAEGLTGRRFAEK